MNRCTHLWDLVNAEAMSWDRFHLTFKCRMCDIPARQAWGTTRTRMPVKLFKKNLPVYEQHFVIES